MPIVTVIHVMLMILAIAVGNEAHPTYQGSIPNGANVPCPPGFGVNEGCQNGLCGAVGHTNCMNAKLAQNPFGLAFLAANLSWTEVRYIDQTRLGRYLFLLRRYKPREPI